MSRFTLLLALAALAACSAPPEIEKALGPEPAGKRYPTLLPLSDVLSMDLGDAEEAEEAEAEMEDRVEALGARADALRSATP